MYNIYLVLYWGFYFKFLVNVLLCLNVIMVYDENIEYNYIVFKIICIVVLKMILFEDFGM